MVLPILLLIIYYVLGCEETQPYRDGFSVHLIQGVKLGIMIIWKQKGAESNICQIRGEWQQANNLVRAGNRNLLQSLGKDEESDQ